MAVNSNTQGSAPSGGGFSSGLDAQGSMNLVASALKIKAVLDEGKAAVREAKRQYEDLDRLGKTELATGTRRAYQASKMGEIMLSNQRAAMASSGGTTTDAGAILQQSQLGRDVRFNVLNELYQGEQALENRRYQGRMRIYEGRKARRAARMKAMQIGIDGLTKAAAAAAGGGG